MNKAGNILKEREKYSSSEIMWAEDVLTYLRIIHIPVLNTFQATLRTRMKRNKYKGFVAQRLKRVSSIVFKLKRESSMQLSRMQDIAGMRVVLDSQRDLEFFKKEMENSKMKHELLRAKDYIEDPKDSGYRGIHLIYKYHNEKISESHGLSIEVQIRTRLQHAWATAVETMGTFLGNSLKSSDGPQEILDFFKITSSAFAHIEDKPKHSDYKNLDSSQTFNKVMKEYTRLKISEKLRAFTVAADYIKTKTSDGKYYLIIMDFNELKVKVIKYNKDQIEEANKKYTEIEREIQEGNPYQAVLVSIDSIDQLEKAYPNYFLDTREFIRYIDSIGKRITT